MTTIARTGGTPFSIPLVAGVGYPCTPGPYKGHVLENASLSWKRAGQDHRQPKECLFREPSQVRLLVCTPSFYKAGPACNSQGLTFENHNNTSDVFTREDSRCIDCRSNVYIFFFFQAGTYQLECSSNVIHKWSTKLESILAEMTQGHGSWMAGFKSSCPASHVQH